MPLSTPVFLSMDAPNWLSSSDYLPRDKEPSHRLHEPESMISTIDPITGLDIGSLGGKPYIVDGNMTIYFASEATRQAYVDTPKNHTLNLPDNPWEDGEAEG